MPLAMHFLFFFLISKEQRSEWLLGEPNPFFFCFANYFGGSDVHSAVNPLWRSLPGLNDSLCCIVHKMKVDLNADDKGQCPPCHPEEKSTRPKFTVYSSDQSPVQSAGVCLSVSGFHKPHVTVRLIDPLAVTQTSLRVHERAQERLHSCKR